MRIDCHQHFWKYSPEEFGWIDDSMAAIRRDFLPSDLKPELKQNGMDGCIAVQAPQALKETEFLLRLQRENPWIVGVVGFLDVPSTDLLGQLEKYADALCGVRYNLQGQTDDFLMSADFVGGLRRLGEAGLTFDICVREHQLGAVIDMVSECPSTPFVLDHIGKPRIAEGQIEPWRSNLLALADLENVFCKLSGIPFEGDWEDWDAESLAPWISIALDAFGVDRCLWGSDWPVSLCAGSYAAHLALLDEFLEPDEVAQVLGANVKRAYPKLAV